MPRYMQIDNQYGFSLVELSIVLVVVGLLLGTTMAGLSDFIWHARNAQAEKDLALIEEALIGFAISEGGLPCPDITDYPAPVGTPQPDGASDGDAVDCDGTHGYLPWADLGLKADDPWGNPYFYAIDPGYSKPQPGDNIVTFDLTEANGNLIVRSAEEAVGLPAGFTVADSLVAVVFSAGPNGILRQADAPADEAENLNATRFFVDRTYEGPDANLPFDDIVDWISTFTLKSKMVQAQRLP